MARNTKYTYIRYLLWVPSILMLTTTMVGSQERREGPVSIFQRMAYRYSTYKSYQDSGVVLMTYFNSDGERIESINFKTCFLRPQFLRFEWSGPSILSRKEKKYILLFDNHRMGIYRDSEIYEKEDDLDLGIAAATGVSGGAAHTIPTLLIKNIANFSLTDLGNLVLKGTETYAGQECFLITGVHPHGDLYEMWIGKKDYLLYKLRTKHVFDKFSVVTTEVHQNIKINTKIRVDVFQTNSVGLPKHK